LFPCELKNWIRGGLRHLEFVYTRKTRVYAHKMAFADSASPKHSATARRGASAHEWRGATANTNTDEEPSSPSVINGSASAELLPRPAPAEAHEELSGFGLRCRLVIFFRADASATFENTSYSNNQNSCDRYVYHTNARRQIQLEKASFENNGAIQRNNFGANDHIAFANRIRRAPGYALYAPTARAWSIYRTRFSLAPRAVHRWL
jgi:hypothetical protein